MSIGNRMKYKKKQVLAALLHIFSVLLNYSGANCIVDGFKQYFYSAAVKLFSLERKVK